AHREQGLWACAASSNSYRIAGVLGTRHERQSLTSRQASADACPARTGAASHLVQSALAGDRRAIGRTVLDLSGVQLSPADLAVRGSHRHQRDAERGAEPALS